MDTNKELATRILQWFNNGCEGNEGDFYTEFLEQYEYDGGSFEDGMGSYFNENEFPFMLTDTWETFMHLYYEAQNATYTHSYDMHFNVTFNKDEEDVENDIIYHSREDYEEIMKNCKAQILKVEQEYESHKDTLSAIIIKDIKKYLK